MVKHGRRFRDVKAWDRELGWDATRNYVEWLREEGELIAIGEVDVDATQVVRRRFRCDSRCCVNWAGAAARVDRSCCTRYDVPVTRRDRKAVLGCLDRVRRNLPPDHRLQDPGASPFRQNDDFGWELVHDGPGGTCEFTIYRDRRRLCAIHLTALEEGVSPFDWKPLACSFWPLALNAYDDDDGETRYLLTVYCEETSELFESAEEEPFACLVGADGDAPPLYESEAEVLRRAFGSRWYETLKKRARALLRGG